MGTCIGILLYNHLDNKCYLLISWIMNFIQGGVSAKFTWVVLQSKSHVKCKHFIIENPFGI
jgi:hypothetical protein